MTRTDGIIKSHPVLIVRIFSSFEKILMAFVVGLLVNHPGAIINFDRVAAAHMRVQVIIVAATLIGAALEVLVFIEGDLCKIKIREMYI